MSHEDIINKIWGWVASSSLLALGLDLAYGDGLLVAAGVWLAAAHAAGEG